MIANKFKDSTVLTIAHRFTTLKDVDLSHNRLEADVPEVWASSWTELGKYDACGREKKDGGSRNGKCS